MACLTNYARASYRVTGSMKQARLLFRRALILDPSNFAAETNLALLYVAENAGHNAQLAVEMLRGVAARCKDPLGRALALGNLAAVWALLTGCRTL